MTEPSDTSTANGGTCRVCARFGLVQGVQVLGVKKHVNFGVCLFLTGVQEVTKPADTSTANE